jgi:serine protease AprX
MQLRPSLLCSSVLSLLPFAAAQSPSPAVDTRAEVGQAELRYTLGGTTVRRWTQGGVAHAAASRDGGASWFALQQPDDQLRFALTAFDPLQSEPQLPGQLGAPAGTRLFVVQFHTQVLGEYRDAVGDAGAEILHVLPSNALIVRCDAAATAGLRQLPCVRWVGALQNGFKLDAALREFVVGGGEPMQVNLVLARKADRLRLAEQVAEVGGQVTDLADGSVLLVAKLAPAQLNALLAMDTVVFADPTGEIGYDMDNARIQGGANYVETQTAGTYRGQGVRAEITEFFQETHPDFAGRFVVRGTNNVSSHGHCTAGIVAGAGAGNASARGMMPDCTVIEGGYTAAASHYAQIQGSASPAWRAMQATASWGSALTVSYTSISQAIDDALFDFDFVRTQSQSNAGTQNSRPEAWAKNMISVGAVRHQNTATPSDDVWSNGASIGPAADGRLKPDICAYYDNVLTSDRTGASGYNTGASPGGDYYASFSGTSSATPIVNGHVGIIQQMFTDGLFGNPLPLPATAANRFENKAHMTTTKALLCNTAVQYGFSGAGADLSRVKQGWGFPSLQKVYDNRNNIVVLDEYDTLQLGQTRRYFVNVAPGTPEFRATMVYADPAAVALAGVTLINNLDLKVTRYSDGTSWWGNNGLSAGNFSTTGGVANNRDNIECVYLQNPTAGIYMVEVTAASITQDAKVETPQLDADFALVMHPVGGGYQTTGGLTLDLQSNTAGELVIAASNVPATGWTEGYTALSFTTSRGRGFGKFFGIEDDGITVALWASGAGAGNPFHFTNTGGVFPFANFVFPDPALISFFSGVQLDGVMVLFDGTDVAAVSNVDRVTLQ